MPHVVCEPCVGHKEGACIEVCPADAIHPTQDEHDFDLCDMVHIDPDECIDCGVCVVVCPVQAIHPIEKVPDHWFSYISRNQSYFLDRDLPMSDCP